MFFIYCCAFVFAGGNTNLKIMDLMTVNDDANYIIQLKVDGKWQTLTEEYSASAASNVMSNAHILTKLDSRFLSKRSDNMVIGECVGK